MKARPQRKGFQSELTKTLAGCNELALLINDRLKSKRTSEYVKQQLILKQISLFQDIVSIQTLLDI
ncbi:MAG: hypothetical protein ACFFKA_00260 [Candidatus Thorarchaeota archaeon]